MFILIHTDGYEIDVVGRFSTLEDAVDEMMNAYYKATPYEGLNEESKSLSHLYSDNAILYANGKDVHVWQVINAIE